MASPPKPRRILRESQPTHAQEATLRAIEESKNLDGMTIEEYAEYLAMTLPGPVHGYHHGPLPPEPTDAEPGSKAKLRVLAWRARRGYALHHPDDNRTMPKAVPTEDQQ